MKIKIEFKNIKAVSHAMSKKTSFNVNMQGILIETNGKENRLVATDGWRLHLVIEKSDGEKTNLKSYFIPTSLVDKILKVKTINQDIIFEFEGKKVKATMVGTKEEFSGELSEQKFPDYREIIPKKFGDEIPSNYNVKFLSDAYKGMKDYLEYESEKKIGIYQRGKEAGIVSKDNFLALVMPIMFMESISENDLNKFTNE